MPEAAELQRSKRRRQLLVKSQEVRYTPGTNFDMSELQRKSDLVSSCTPSVLCDSEWDLINDSILDIYAVNLQLGAMALCTGVSLPYTSCPSNEDCVCESLALDQVCSVIEPYKGVTGPVENGWVMF